MADISDVMDELERMVVAAIYPTGAGTPSITTRPVTIAQGWPPSEDVDAAVAAGASLVSIYSEPSTTSPMGSSIDSSYVASGPTAGTTVELDDPSATIGGQPMVGDVVVAKLNGIVYAYAVQQGDTTVSVAQALLAMVVQAHPDAVVQGSTLTVASANYLYVAVSGTGAVALKIHQQRSQFQITVWAPSPADRSRLAAAVDVAVKAQVRRPLADTTSLILSYQGTNLKDKDEKQGVFVRDVLLNVTYDTILLMPGQEVVAATVASS